MIRQGRVRTGDCRRAGVGVNRQDIPFLYKSQDRQGKLLHVFGQMDCELLPAAAHIATELAWLIPGTLCRFLPALLHQVPELLALYGIVAPGLAGFLALGFGHLMLTDQMLHEIVLAVAGMVAIWQRARPPLQLAVPLILVSNPVRFAFERFWLGAPGERASERLHIFVHMLGPIRRLLELFHLETYWTFKFSGEPLNWRQGNPRGELSRGYSAFTTQVLNVWVSGILAVTGDLELSLCRI